MIAGGQRLIPIEDAHRTRLGALYHLLNTHLYAKKEQLNFQKSQLQLKLAQVREVKLTIDMDMKNEFSSMNERLNSIYKAKEALLQHICQEIRFDLDRIASIASNVETLGNDPVGFLLKTAAIMADCEMVLAKGYTDEIPVVAEDFPKELTDVRRVCEDYQPMLTLLDFKDETMWRLKNRPASKTNLRQEVVEWARLADGFSQELTRLKLVCELCGCSLDQESVNSSCPKSSRHHWVRPSKSQPQSQALPMTVKTPPEREGPGDVLRLLSKQALERKVDLNALFRHKDSSQSGAIRDSDLFQVLVSAVGLSERQAGQLVDRFDPSQTGSVAYEGLIRDLAGVQIGEKLLEVLESLKRKDKKQTGMIAEKKLRNALLKAEISAEEVQRMMGSAERSGEGEVKYRESLLKWAKV
jgi:Ca2+-binding EF-hand superfamily protein